MCLPSVTQKFRDIGGASTAPAVPVDDATAVTSRAMVRRRTCVVDEGGYWDPV